MHGYGQTGNDGVMCSYIIIQHARCLYGGACITSEAEEVPAGADSSVTGSKPGRVLAGDRVAVRQPSRWRRHVYSEAAVPGFHSPASRQHECG